MKEVEIAEVMNPRVRTVSEDMPVRDLAEFLVENEISGAPVVDDDGRPVGVVSATDIARLAIHGAAIARDVDNPNYEVRGRSFEEHVRQLIREVRPQIPVAC